MSFGADVWVGMMGSKLEANTMDATGFHNAMLVISWCVWRTSIFMVALGNAVEVGSITFCVYLLLYLFMNLMEYHELALPL
jgi:hypothetical protein